MPGGSAKKYWKFPRCLKLTRILRPNRIITFLDVRDYMKLYLKLLKTIFYLVIYLHIVACLWFLIVDTDDKWVPPLDYPFAETHLYERDRTYKYL